MSTKGEIKARLEKLQKAAREDGDPTPHEVARAQMHYHETGGQWPKDASPRTIELAQAMMEASRLGMAIFDPLTN